MSSNTLNKVWFITGASRGFGAEIAKDALGRGDLVVATARNPKSVLDLFGENPNLLALKLDVTDEAGTHEAAKLAIEKFGRIDILLNNAGFGLLGAVEESSAAEVQAVFEANVFGLLHVTRAVLPHLRMQGSGHILNISSIGGYASHAGWGSIAPRNSPSRLSRRRLPWSSHRWEFTPQWSNPAFSGRIS